MKIIFNYLTVLLLVFIMVGCQSKPIDYDTLKERGERMYAPNEQEPFTGNVFQLDENGTKIMEGSYKNGLKDGEWKRRQENGSWRKVSYEEEIALEPLKIGEHKWMKKNLDVDHYRNGDLIPEVKDPKEWSTLTTGAWCYYDNNAENGEKFGKLYNWYAINDPRFLAPTGWHLPTIAEFSALSKAVSGDGNSLKAIGQGLGAGAGTNTSGFSALLSGYRYHGTFRSLGYWAVFWRASEFGAAYGYYLYLVGNVSDIGQSYEGRVNGLSVRCVKD